MWPGTSRSLVTIVAALLLGYSIVAAVEFSFLLGFLTLGAATGVLGAEGRQVDGRHVRLLTPLVGFVVAFFAAVVSVRWMVSYLQRHDLSIFGWYRLAVAALVGDPARDPRDLTLRTLPAWIGSTPSSRA